MHIDTFPAEILSKILRHCLGIWVDDPARLVGQRRLICQVSPRWRIVGHGDPVLWSFILLNAALHWNDLDDWLSRSGNRPLHLCFIYAESDTFLSWVLPALDPILIAVSRLLSFPGMPCLPISSCVSFPSSALHSCDDFIFDSTPTLSCYSGNT